MSFSERHIAVAAVVWLLGSCSSSGPPAPAGPDLDVGTDAGTSAEAFTQGDSGDDTVPADEGPQDDPPDEPATPLSPTDNAARPTSGAGTVRGPSYNVAVRIGTPHAAVSSPRYRVTLGRPQPRIQP